MEVVIPLSRGMSTVVDAETFESECVYHRRDGQQIFCKPSTASWHAVKNRNFYYATAVFAGFTIVLHRLLLNAPASMLVDHWDRDTLNNRLTNLRLCSHSGNMANTAARGGASRFKGVRNDRRQKNGWMAQIQQKVNGRNVHHYLGTFATEEAAARAYDAAALERFGEFARLNFPQ